MRFLFKNRKKGYIITFKRIADYMHILKIKEKKNE